MAGLPFQKHITYQAVAVGIQGSCILIIGIHQDVSLKHSGFLGVRSHVVQLFPAVHILLHRFPVKEYHRSSCVHGLVNDDGGRRTVHAVDAQGIAAQGNETLHLAVLGILTPLGVHDIQLYLDPCFLFIFLCLVLQAGAQSADEGVIPPVEQNPDADRVLIRLPPVFPSHVLPHPYKDSRPHAGCQ